MQESSPALSGAGGSEGTYEYGGTTETEGGANMARTQVTPLLEWHYGTPPQGRYLLEVDNTQYHVDVGHGTFKWDGVSHTIAYAFEIGKLLGPLRSKNAEEEKDMKHGREKQRETSEIPGIDAETDAKIRAALKELAERPFARSNPELAARVAVVYGDEIKKVREGNRCWRKIASVFKQHGVLIGHKLLRAKAERLQ
jgi:hypothetical protein